MRGRCRARQRHNAARIRAAKEKEEKTGAIKNSATIEPARGRKKKVLQRQKKMRARRDKTIRKMQLLRIVWYKKGCLTQKIMEKIAA